MSSADGDGGDAPAREDEVGADEAVPAREYDRCVVQHLQTIPDARLWVGDDLACANWGGLNQTFGPLLAPHSGETILAVYDDSAFGRGRAGFIVTDVAVYYVQRTRSGRLPLEEVRSVKAASLSLLIGLSKEEATRPVTLRVDEWDARNAVEAFFRAVVSRNRVLGKARELEVKRLTGNQALKRLEDLAASGQLRHEHRDRLRALVARLDAPPGRDKASKGGSGS